MKVRLVTIGDEILIGQIVDSNSAYIARKLNEIGLEVEEILSVSDSQPAIVETLTRILPQTDIIITTGGLGPTKDDVTKTALCGFLQSELVMDEQVLSYLEDRFRKLDKSMNELNRKQALIPQKSIAIHNPLGTAPGIWTEFQNVLIINLQGVPFEMKNLMKTEILPRLQQKFSLPYVIHRHLSVSDYPESDLAITLEDWENNLPDYLHLAYLPERGKVKLRITGKGIDRSVLETEIQNQIERIMPLLGSHLDSAIHESIEAILGDKLCELGLTISTAESCTGGNIAQMLTAVSGSSSYFKGSVVSYATEVKEKVLGVSHELVEKHTVVSEEVAVAMARGVRKHLGTDIAVSTTGVAGPAKGEDGKEIGTVWIAVTDGNSVRSVKYFFPYLERADFVSQVSRLALQNVFKFIQG